MSDESSRPGESYVEICRLMTGFAVILNELSPDHTREILELETEKDNKLAKFIKGFVYEDV